jgi:DNA-binding beta-propeller fold protein YncE
MDQDDPEKRIAELARPGDGAVSRRFVASAAPPSTKQMIKYTYVLIALTMASLGVLYTTLFLVGALVGSTTVMQVGGIAIFFSFSLLARPAFAMFQRRMNREKKVLVDVGIPGLTVSTRSGIVFSFGDVQLGNWTLEGHVDAARGTALHLRTGRDRFVLGGRDHRVADEIPLAATPVDSVDASMSAPEFDELLSMVSHAGGLDDHAPATARADAAEAPAPGGPPQARPKRKLWIYAIVIAVVMFVVAPAIVVVAESIWHKHQLKDDRRTADGERQFALPFNDLRMPHGVAVDAAGNVYVTDARTNRVLKLAAGSNTQTVLPFTGLDLCPDMIDAASGGVAVDAGGNVYVTDSCHNRVLKLAAGSNTQTVLPITGLDGAQGVAVDGAGTVYVVDYSHNRVVKLTAGSSTKTVLPSSGNVHPSGDIAVDNAGNVYISCSRGRVTRSCLMRLAPESNTWTRLPSAPDHSGDTLSTGEQDVAVDAAGNVYMITSKVVMKLAAGSDNWTALPGLPPFVDPMGLAVDPRGNSVYVTDHTGSRSTEENLPWQKDDARGLVLKLPAA